MKFNFFQMSAMTLLAVSTFLSSCGPDPVKEEPTPSNLVELSGAVPSQTLDVSKKYLIKGIVTVEDGSTLTIPAGTVLMGEKKTKGTLVIKPGAKLIAEGTEMKPIVFTSNQEPGEREQGDWGGLIVLGKANCNQNNPAIEGISPAVNYGTFNSSANDDDNSGILKYVRIEYAGIALTPNNETNSLTLGAVGRGTTVEFVQATYGGDDNFEWFGGTVNCKNLISMAAWDDDFDCDFGFSGKVQFGVAIRDPFNADQSGSNGFEVDNDASGTTATPKTSVVFSNMTIIGPSFDSSKSISGNYQHGMHLRRNCEISIFNSIIAGFPIGLNIDGSATVANFTGGLGILDNNILVSAGANRKAPNPFVSGTSASTTVADYWKTTKSNLVFTQHSPTSGSPAHSKALADAGIPAAVFMGYNTTAGVSGNYPKNPDFATFTGLTQTGALFGDSKLSTWFTSVSHKGAFGSNDWTNNWSNFNPQFEAY